MNQTMAHSILLKHNVLENPDFDPEIDYLAMLKELNGYAKMYGGKQLK